MKYLTSNDNKNMTLIQSEDTSRYFSASYLALKDFLKYIRTYPDIVYKILKLANQKYLTNDFADFILNNFYEDILNPITISKDFLYVIEHLLRDIVGQCDTPNDFEKIYKESNLALIINNVICMKEVKIYFNSILGNIINKYICSDKSSKILFFEINELNNFIKNRENNYKRLYRNSDYIQKQELKKIQNLYTKSINSIYKMRFNSFENMSIESISDLEENTQITESEQNEEFATKYLLELNKNEIKKQIQNSKDNKNLKEYLQYQLNYMNKNDDNIYSNQKLFEKIQKSKEYEKILFYYQRNFLIAIEIINEIIEEIQLTIDNMPNIMKYILKMFVDIMKNKFPHIKMIEIYSNLSYLIVGIINNSFYNLNYNLLLSEELLGSKIKQNLNVIISIFSQLISLKFYLAESKSDYTPFNLYFIEKISSIYSIYEKIMEFNSPYTISFTRKRTKIFSFYGNDNNATNVSNNDKKLFYSISICYRVEDITTLLNIIQQNKNEILEEKTSLYPNDKFKIIFDKLKDNKEIFKALKEKEKENSTINYYILFEIIYSNELNDFVNSKSFSQFFKLEKLENKNNSKKIIRKNSLISTQNALSELLINMPALESTSIDDKNINNLRQIINDLLSYIKNKYNIMEYFKEGTFEETEEKIPPEWYINSFIEILDKMDEKYKKKEYEKFFKKFKKSIQNQIDKYKFDILGKLNESINNISDAKNEYIYMKNIFEEVNLNDKIKEIIKNEIIEVEFKFKYTQKEKYLNLNTINMNYDKNIDNSNINDTKICFNISEFTKNFPDLNDIHKQFDISIFNIEKDLKINEFLNSYLNLINSTILSKYKNENKQKIISKIRKYIIIKIFDKIFPIYEEENDLNIQAKLLSLKKIKPDNFNISEFDFDSIIPIINNLFIKLDEQKYPADKLNIINQIFEVIFKIINYIKGEEYSDDDLSNLCEYFLMKVKPEKIYSNVEFLNIFKDNNESDDDKINLKLLKRSIDNLLNDK